METAPAANACGMKRESPKVEYKTPSPIDAKISDPPQHNEANSPTTTLPAMGFAFRCSIAVIGVCSVHESRSKGARKSKPIAAMTSTVATMSPTWTSQFDNGRAHASPSAHATFDER